MFTLRDARESGAPDSSLTSESRFSIIRENLSVLLAPVRLAAQAPGTQPFQIGSLWRRSEVFGRSQWLSVAMHGLLLAAVAIPFAHRVVNSPTGTSPQISTKDLRPYIPHFLVKSLSPASGKATGGGGGGERNPTPASVGQLPDVSRTQFTPPTMTRNPEPRLPMKATLQGPEELKAPNLPYSNFGVPNAPNFTDSAGPGSRGGFGTGDHGGIGDHRGPGTGPGDDGGVGGVGPPRAGDRGTNYPECLYCPRPAYTDDARKAKVQGSVELRLIVTADGRAANIEIVRGLGLGLDEAAIEAVRGWHFKPSHDVAGRAVATWVTVEVTFRLL